MKTEAYIERNLQGFEGDHHIKAAIIALVKRFGIQRIIETGTYLGGSTRQFSEMVPRVDTIELDFNNWCKASGDLSPKQYNVFWHKGSSPDVLPTIIYDKTDEKILFFLDAHWGNYCPLLDELKIIAEKRIQPVIVIHDFKVPGRKDLGYDSYNGQDLSKEYIEQALEQIYMRNGGKGYSYYYNDEAAGAKRGVIYIYPVQ